MWDRIRIQERAREYIVGHGRVITIKIERNKSLGCSGPRGGPCPELWLGPPAEHEQHEYRVIEMENIVAHMHESVQELNRSVLLDIVLEGPEQKRQLCIHAVPNERPNDGR